MLMLQELKISGINHITFATSNLSISVAFYQDILGCKLLARWNSGAYFLSGNLWLCLSLDMQTKNKPLSEYSHVAFQIEKDQFEIMVKKLKKCKVRSWKENKSEGVSFYFLDPDHNKLELHCNSLQDRIDSMNISAYPGLKLY